MIWSDERYVKLYSRDTTTWKSLPWQAKCLLPLLMRKVDGAGILDVGSMEPVEAVAMMVEIPSEVVTHGLSALLEKGIAKQVDGGVLLPKFLEAQESVKTMAQKKRDQRERERSRRISGEGIDIIEAPVTRSHSQSLAVTSCPPPAQPSPAQPSPKKKIRSSEWSEAEKNARASFEDIFLKARGIPLPWTNVMDSAPFREKLRTYGQERMERYWRYALSSDDRYLRVSTVAALCGKNFSRIADAAEGTAPGHSAVTLRAPICEVIS